MSNIIIGADFIPTESNLNLFTSGNLEALLGDDLIELLSGSSFRIFNLELPLTDEINPISKCGSNLFAKTAAVTTYSKLSVDLLTLANNHILDQGDEGLFSTIEVLKKNNIGYVGAGKTINDASRPFIFKFAGKKIGVYACAEHEFSIASAKSAGANPFDPLNSLDHVKELKEKVDFVIVLYHGGKEYYRYPSPNLQKVCRKFIDKGADLIICQHSHCIGCEEEYKSGIVVYGQGNFLFDDGDSDFLKTSLLISLDEDLSVNYIPLVKHNSGVRRANPTEEEHILKAFEERSKAILDDDYIEEQYSLFANNMLDYYLSAFNGKKTIVYRIVNKLMKNKLRHLFVTQKYKKKQALAIRNYIECEAHRELVIEALKEKINT